NLDYLREAADIASRAISDEPLAIQLLGRLYEHAGNLLSRGAPATGRLAAARAPAQAGDERARMPRPAAAAHRAADSSVRRHAASRAAERLGSATTLLLDTARLRVSDERRRGWLR